MPGLDHDRFRNRSITFRVSPDEYQLIQARFKVSGVGKAEFVRRSILECQINIVAGRYQSDRLSLELRRLREWTDSSIANGNTDEVSTTLKESKALLNELKIILEKISAEQNK